MNIQMYKKMEWRMYVFKNLKKKTRQAMNRSDYVNLDTDIHTLICSSPKR